MRGYLALVEWEYDIQSHLQWLVLSVFLDVAHAQMHFDYLHPRQLVLSVFLDGTARTLFDHHSRFQLHYKSRHESRHQEHCMMSMDLPVLLLEAVESRLNTKPLWKISWGNHYGAFELKYIPNLPIFPSIKNDKFRVKMAFEEWECVEWV
jgi:hypothetical protein